LMSGAYCMGNVTSLRGLSPTRIPLICIDNGVEHLGVLDDVACTPPALAFQE
jgi:hypothetical protein